MWVLLLFILLVFVCSCIALFWQPIILGFILIRRSLLVCLFIAAEIRRVLGLIMFLTYVRGVIVLFLYVLRIFPNEVYYIKFNLFLVYTGLIIGISMYIGKDINLFSSDNNILNFSFISNLNHCGLYLLIALILLYIIIVVSYLCIKKNKPLRSF